MKSVNKIKEKKHKTIKKSKVKASKEKVLIVAQEIKFARLLSGNEKKTRDRVLKTLKKWLSNCFSKQYEFKEDDFIRIWKGLFYAVWMSDKPLVQEELCESIAEILDIFPLEHLKYAFLMMKAGFKVLATEWYGIDQHRIDKFLMLVRRVLRGGLRCVGRSGWTEAGCRGFAQALADQDGVLCPKTPLYARNAGSMLLHIIDCFLEELSKVSEGQLPPASVAWLVNPFSAYMCSGESELVCARARRLHTELLRQSDLGLDYQGRTRAWQSMGCPQGGPDAIELVSDDDGEDDEQGEDNNDGEDDEMQQPDQRPLDPRAGRVDVKLAPLPVPAKEIARMLRKLLTTASSKAHRRTRICLQRFEQLAKNEYPLQVEEEEWGVGGSGRGVRVGVAARKLYTLDQMLLNNEDQLTLESNTNLTDGQETNQKRRRKRARTRRHEANGNWEVESTEPAEKANTTDSNKENVHKSKKSKKRKHPNAETGDNVKKQKSGDNDEQIKTETPTKNVIDTKSYEKVTKSHKNRNKKHKISKHEKIQNKVVNGNNKAKKENDRKEKSQGHNQTSNEKVKFVKENLQTKQNDSITKNDKKKSISELNTDKVLTKSNKQNETKSATAKEQDQRQQNIKNHKHAKKTSPSLLVNKVKNYQKKTSGEKQSSPQKKVSYETPKKVKFVLKNNSMQGPVDYYKSVRQSPNIPFDSSKQPTKTNLKVSTPSPINPFFKKKLRIK